MADESKFTLDEAQAMIQLARAAPLRNLDDADKVRDLLVRFIAWANPLLLPSAPVDIPTAPQAAIPARPAPEPPKAPTVGGVPMAESLDPAAAAKLGA